MIAVMAWFAGVLLAVGCVEHVLFHWPVRNQMAVEDFLLRGGLLLLIMTVVGCIVGVLLYVVFAMPLSFGTALWVALPALCIAAVGIVGGFSILLWKYRRSRSTAALQPNVGVPPEEDY